MNSLIEFAVVGAIVAAAVAFILIRTVRALRGGRPSCCEGSGPSGCDDPAEAGKAAASPCAGCSGCGGH